MTFTTPCIFRPRDEKQRKEAVEWLEKIGYKESWHDDKRRYDYICLMTSPSDFFCALSNISTDTHHDCGSNLPLFKALSALRDDSDYMQWFVDPFDNWELCCGIAFMLEDWQYEYPHIYEDYKKATAEQLIEHFKE